MKSVRESRFLRSDGREFQRWGAERLKAPLPMVTRRAGGRDREVDRGGRSEGTGRGGDVEEFGQIRRGKVEDGLERKQ